MEQTEELQLNLFGDETEDVVNVKKEENKSKNPKKAETKKKNTTSTSSNTPKTGAKKEKQKFKYPFSIYSNGNIDISNYGFENDKEYTEDEIAKIMLSHKHYEFSADKKYFKYIKEDNVVYFSGADFKKG